MANPFQLKPTSAASMTAAHTLAATCGVALAVCERPRWAWIRPSRDMESRMREVAVTQASEQTNRLMTAPNETSRPRSGAWANSAMAGRATRFGSSKCVL